MITGCQVDELRVDLMGVNSLYGTASKEAPAPQEVRLRVAARTKCREEAEKIGNEVEALYTNGPARGRWRCKKRAPDCVGSINPHAPGRRHIPCDRCVNGGCPYETV